MFSTACSRPLGRVQIPSIIRALAIAGIARLILLVAGGAPPQWWETQGVATGEAADDYALANQGQLKHFAAKAFLELQLHAADYPDDLGLGDLTTPDAVGYRLTQLYNSIEATRLNPTPETDNYATLNLGQLKYVAEPFYTRLIQLGIADRYPWGAQSAAADDFALANIGQLKAVFNFNLQWDDDQDGLPNWWENAANFSLGSLNPTNPAHDPPALTQPGSGSSPQSPVPSIPNGNVQSLDPDGPLVSAHIGGGYANYITLSWDAPAPTDPPILYYRVYQFTESALVAGSLGWTIIEDNIPTNTRQCHVDTVHGDRFHWRVAAVTAFGEAYSSEISWTPPPWVGFTGRQWGIVASKDYYSDWVTWYPLHEPWPTPPWPKYEAGVDPLLVALNHIDDEENPLPFEGGAPLWLAWRGPILGNSVQIADAEFYIQTPFSLTLPTGVPARTYKVCRYFGPLDAETSAFDVFTECSVIGIESGGTSDLYHLGVPNEIGMSHIGVAYLDARISKHYDTWVEQDYYRPWLKPEPELSEETVGYTMASDEKAYLEIEGPARYYFSGYDPSFDGNDFRITFDGSMVALSPDGVTWNDSGTLAGLSGSIVIGTDNHTQIWGVYVRLKDAVPPDHESIITCDLLWKGTTILATDKVKVRKAYPNLVVGLDEAAGPLHRKIGLNGRPLADTKPQQRAGSSVEPEATFIDAMTLGLRHATTDIHVPLPGSDMALSVRRDSTSEIWTTATGLRPHERRERPFGIGWRSNLCCYAEFSGPYVTVHDLEGAEHRFIGYYYNNGQSLAYIPLPRGVSDTESHLSRLEYAYVSELEGTKFRFTSKSGTVIWFDPSGFDLAAKARREGGGESVPLGLYYRAESVEDRAGNRIELTYPFGETLIPSTIAAAKPAAAGVITIFQDKGLIKGIVDPNGNHYKYHYSEYSYDIPQQPNAGPLMEFWLSEVEAPDGAVTRYSMNITSVLDTFTPVSSTADPLRTYWFADLAQIEDPDGRLWGFEYTFDLTKWNYRSGRAFVFDPTSGDLKDVANVGYHVQFPVPRCVMRVNTPEGTANFENLSDIRLGNGGGTMQGQRKTVAKAVAVNGVQGVTTYDFGTATVFRANALESVLNPRDVPLIFCYKNLTVFHSNGSTESFAFEAKAGMALASATDLSGNTTTFHHDEPVVSPPPFFDVFNFSGFNSRHSEPSKQVNAAEKEKVYTYGDFRLPATVTDEEGNTTTWARDGKGRVTQETRTGPKGGILTTEFHYEDENVPGLPTKRTVKKAMGDTAAGASTVTTYTYDAGGRLMTEVVDPGDAPEYLALTRTHQYDANGNCLLTTDPNGNATAFSYDERNRLIKVTYPGLPPHLSTKNLAYDRRGNKTSETDENGVTTTYSYNGLNLITAMQRGDATTRYEYDPLGNQTAIIDPKGRRTEKKYDSLQRVTEVKDALNNKTTYVYGTNSGGSVFTSAEFKPTLITDARGFHTKTEYDVLYRPTKISREHQANVYAVTDRAYDDVGNLTWESDPLEKETFREYDSLNREVKVTFADDTECIFFYNSLGQLWKSVNERGYETRTVYDSAGRAIKRIGPEFEGNAIAEVTATVETVYDAAGNVIATINPLNKRWDFVFDERNRKIKELQPAVHDATGLAGAPDVRPTLKWFYDGVGNILAAVDARGKTTLKTYDEFNRVVRRQLPEQGGIHNWQFDAAGNLIQEVDELGRATNNEYDALNRLITTTDAADIRVRYEYDAVGNRTKVVDGKSQTTIFSYDGMGRLTSVEDPAPKTTVFGYDGVNKTRRTDSLGRITDYTYDDRHRLETISYLGDATQNRVYSYDDNGNLLSVDQADELADTAYGYDAADRMASETSAGVTHAYEYDLASNRTKVTYGGTEREFVSIFDALNRLSSATDTAGGAQTGITTTYGYDLAGNVVYRTLPNGDVVTTTYDAQNRAKVISAVTTPKANFAEGEPLYAYTMTYDRVGNVTKSEEIYGPTSGLGARTVNMVYDRANRLVEETEVGGAGQTTTYTYDAANNRTGKTVESAGPGESYIYGYNSLNQLISVSGSGGNHLYSYDFNGNRTHRDGPDGDDTAYGYDQENRLVSVTGSHHGQSLNQSYAYDYRGRRVARDEGSGATKIAFSGGTSVQERDATDAVRVEYLRGSDWGGGVGGLLYAIRPNQPITFNHYNHRGDIVAEVSGGGSVLWQGQYEAFGTREQEFGDKTNRQTANTKEEDPGGLLNEGFRYRDLETGTFLTRDPAGFVDGPNLYAYVRQNPWSKFDPEGLAAEALAFPALGEGLAALGAAAGPAAAVAAVGGAAAFCVYGGYLHLKGKAVESAQLSQTRATQHARSVHEADYGPAGGGFSPSARPNVQHVNEPGAQAPQLEGRGSTQPQNAPQLEGKPANPVQTPDEAVVAQPSLSAQQISEKTKGEVNGNSHSSTKPQHVYVIRDKDGNLVKIGISGQPLNQDDSSPRANRQISGTGNTAEVVEKIPGGEGARLKAKESEQRRVDDYAKKSPNGQGPPGNKLPRPSNQQ